MLAEAFIVGDNVGKDAEKSKTGVSLRSIALQLIEEIIFLAEIDDRHTSADGMEIDDIEEDLIFGSVKDFEFDNEESSGSRSLCKSTVHHQLESWKTVWSLRYIMYFG